MSLGTFQGKSVLNGLALAEFVSRLRNTMGNVLGAGCWFYDFERAPGFVLRKTSEASAVSVVAAEQTRSPFWLDSKIISRWGQERNSHWTTAEKDVVLQIKPLKLEQVGPP